MTRPISVSQLNRYVAALLESNENLSGVLVKGEISGFKLYASGHCYFTLKDQTAAVPCVMFRSAAQSLRFRPADGVRVIVTAKATLYEKDGRFQLSVQAMQADGVGDLYLAFEQLKKNLQGEGLFDPAHKKKLPVLPRAIGVVTSPSGAVIRDIITVLGRRFPNFRLQLIPVQVQGEGAAASIAAAIEQFNRLNTVDVLIVGRGGGSLEDLWAFNEEIVARAVYQSRIPVISAVGHETDYTICDFVADVRAATPSAAAELAMPERHAEQDKITRQRHRLQQALLKRAQVQRQRLARLRERPCLVRPLERLDRCRQDLDLATDRLQQAANRRLHRAERDLAILAGKLDALSPLKVLTRGYAVVQGPSGQTIVSSSQVRCNERILVWLRDGQLDCTVNLVTGQ